MVIPPPWMRAADGAIRGGSGVSLDPAAPQQGLAVPMAGSTPAQRLHHLLGIAMLPPGSMAAPPAPSDCWIRGSDCTAIYEPVDPRALRATIMWRQWAAAAPGHVTAPAVWEVIVSAQTALLQSNPTLGVVSTIGDAGELWWGQWQPEGLVFSPTPAPAAAHGVLVRTGSERSILLLAHPGDQQRIDLETRAGECRVTCWVFSTPVEKGVLLRSRVLAAVGPATGDTLWAGSVAAAFAASPPVLST